MTVEAMTAERFWQIIDRTAEFQSDPGEQIIALHAALSELSADEIAAFELAFGEQLQRSYSWDLWGAAYVIHGGASDDGFDYFRFWLLSKGREFYERALADPDSLASCNMAAGPDDVWELEEFGYVAAEVWSDKTGEDAIDEDEDGFPRRLDNPGQPSGEPFDEDDEHLMKRYPKLWARFGESPLG